MGSDTPTQLGRLRCVPASFSLPSFFGKFQNIRWLLLIPLLLLTAVHQAFAASNRSALIPYHLESWWPQNAVALDTSHQQLFVSLQLLDRVDVLSTQDYHLIQSIITPSPSAIDISPDNSTIAVGNNAATVTFFSTTSFAPTSQFVIPETAGVIDALVYTATFNLVMTSEVSAQGGGTTEYWNHSTNQILNYTDGRPYIDNPTYFYSVLNRSSDYTRIMIGIGNGWQAQVIDGTTGKGDILYTWDYSGDAGSLDFGQGQGSITWSAVSTGGNRYAICWGPVASAPQLYIYDSKFNQIYVDPNQDSSCYGMFFSPDGNTLYRDMTINNQFVTGLTDMNTFEVTAVPNYSTPSSDPVTARWMAADGSGMIYGTYGDSGESVQALGYVGEWIAALDTAAGTAPPPPPTTVPMQLLRVVQNIGSPQGGDSINLLCSGLNNQPISAVRVSIGGKSATVTSITNVLGNGVNPNSRYQMVTVTTPTGTSGNADVSVQALGATSTLPQSFQYAQNRTIYPFSTSPAFLAYDSTRQRLYASHGAQVEIIDPVRQQVMTPLVPAGRTKSSNFAGISISPDGNRLWVADSGSNLIHMISLNNPGSGSTLDPTLALSSTQPVSPLRVFELADGTLIGTNTNAFTIDPSTQSGQWIPHCPDLNYSGDGFVWGTTNSGESALLSCNGEPSIWNVNSGLTAISNESSYRIPTSEPTINEDGTVIATPFGTPGTQLMDFRLNISGYLYEQTSSEAGGYSPVWHPTGALLYQVMNSPLPGVDIADSHQWQDFANVVFPEPFVTQGASFAGEAEEHQLAIDPTGQYIFGITQSGITQIVLNSIPLSIGNLQPAFVQTSGTQQITIRGSGFLPGATASFGGVSVATNYVDSETLTATPPSLNPGWSDVTVSLPNGASYTAPALLHVLAQITTPNITGSSPANLMLATPPTWGSGITGISTITLIGAGFDISDTVTANGVPSLSAFTDANHIQAQFGTTFTDQTGSVAFTVTSPYTGASNNFLVPVVNPVPVIQQTVPSSLPLNGPDITLRVMGTGLVNGPTAQFNGQNVQASYEGQWDQVVIPASMLQTAGTGVLTISNPGPGGGVSNAFSIQISASAPLANVQLTTSTTRVPSSQPLSITAKVTGNAAAPSGEVTLLDGTTMLNSESLYTSNTLTFTIGPLSPGQHNIAAGYSGDTTYAPATSATLPINVVAVATPAVTVTPLLSSVTTAQSLSVTVAVAGSAGGPVPTGTVSLIGDGYGSPATTLQSGSAVFNISAGTLVAGTAYLVAQYAPDASSTFAFGPSSGSATVSVIAPVNIASTFSVSASNVTVAVGTSGTSTVTVNSTNGYAGTVTLTCSITSSPAGASDLPGCSPGSAATLSAGASSQTTSVAITTTAPVTAFDTRPASRILGGLGALTLAGIFLWPQKRGLSRWLCLFLTIGVAALISSCGGGGGTGNPPPTSNPGTTPGAYTITVSATGNDATQTTDKTTFTLTVN